MLNLYHVVHGVAVRRRRRVPAPDADVPRRVDGRHRSACPRERRHVGVRAAVRSRRGAWTLIEQHTVTMTVMVPTMIGMLLNHPDVPARAARERCARSPTARRRCRRRCSTSCSRAFPTLDIFQGYGMTECVGGAHRARPRRAPRRRRAPALGRAGRCPASCCRSRTPTATSLPAGRDRRGVRARRQLHARVLEPARGDGRGVPRRLVPHRRRGLPRRATATCSSSTG